MSIDFSKISEGTITGAKYADGTDIVCGDVVEIVYPAFDKNSVIIKGKFYKQERKVMYSYDMCSFYLYSKEKHQPSNPNVIAYKN